MKLSKKQNHILNAIEKDEDARGITPTELTEKSCLNKSTISYHIGKLESNQLVTSIRVGRNKFIDITEKGAEALEEEPAEEARASCGNCGQNHPTIKAAKECCTGSFGETQNE